MFEKAKQLFLVFRFLDHKTGSNYHNKICTYLWEDECVCFVFLLPYFLIFLGRLPQRAITFRAYSLPVNSVDILLIYFFIGIIVAFSDLHQLAVHSVDVVAA